MQSRFKKIWLCDFEYTAPSGDRPTPVCLVARELNSGTLIRVGQDQLLAMKECPFDTGLDSLLVAYYASAELGCFLALGWTLPQYIIDLCAEFKRITSGYSVTGGKGLLGALTSFGIYGISTVEKTEMRDLAIRGGPYTDEEMADLIDYCQTDVDALERLWPHVTKDITSEARITRALFRGHYMSACAVIEHNGIPVDTESLKKLRDNWDFIKVKIIEAVNKDYDIYEGTTFKLDRFINYVNRNDMAWPLLETGTPDLSRDTFRDMSRVYPEIAPLYEVRENLSQLKLNDLAVGSDGRNRTMLSAFGSRTGRNQPSNTRFIFGPSVWLRSLIQPKPGTCVAYIDYEQQEFGIGAALAKDTAMMQAYSSGDPYLEFAKQARAVPLDATKQSHKGERDLFKQCSLAVQYGMGETSLSIKISQPISKARWLLTLHKETYPAYWEWSDKIETTAMLRGSLETALGWLVHTTADANPRSMRNFPLQGNGAEMLRVACCLGVENNINIIAPIHDAILIEAKEEEIEEKVKQMQDLMQLASQDILNGYSLRTDVKIVRHPDRWSDERGSVMWDKIMGLCA